jgi:hypothetical protein
LLGADADDMVELNKGSLFLTFILMMQGKYSLGNHFYRL